MEQAVKEIESLKKGEKFYDFCIDDAIFHICKAQEILKAAETDPEYWYNQQRDAATMFVQVLPFLVASNCLKKAENHQ